MLLNIPLDQRTIELISEREAEKLERKREKERHRKGSFEYKDQYHQDMMESNAE